MMVKKKLFPLLLVLLLLTGCGGGPTAVEGAEPSSTPETPAPVEAPQEPEPAPTVEVFS